MVLEDGLDISNLQDTLKEDFEKLDRLESQYLVTSFHMEIGDLEVLSARNGPPCTFGNVKEEAEKINTIVVHHKPMMTFSKVILSD